ncbi:phage minor tail protein [Escherichia coli]|nr:phage minor tail protein [Escherichia coli]GDT89897.1 phage minor tail protein [Escherichia coli]
MKHTELRAAVLDALEKHDTGATFFDGRPAVFDEGKRLVRTVLIFTESSDQLSRATDRVPGLPASPGYVQ